MTHFILCCNFPTGGLIFDFTLQHLDAGNFFISLEIFSGLDATYYLTIYILDIYRFRSDTILRFGAVLSG